MFLSLIKTDYGTPTGRALVSISEAKGYQRRLVLLIPTMGRLWDPEKHHIVSLFAAPYLYDGYS